MLNGVILLPTSANHEHISLPHVLEVLPSSTHTLPSALKGQLQTLHISIAVSQGAHITLNDHQMQIPQAVYICSTLQSSVGV